MVEERDLLSIAREAWIADPARSFVQNFSQGILERIDVAVGVEAHHGKVFAVGRPVSVLHGIQYRARCASANGQARQRADAHISRADGTHSLSDQKFASGRDGRQSVGYYTKRTHALTVEPCRV